MERPNFTIYINNLNEKVKKEGNLTMSILVLIILHILKIVFNFRFSVRKCPNMYLNHNLHFDSLECWKCFK